MTCVGPVEKGGRMHALIMQMNLDAHHCVDASIVPFERANPFKSMHEGSAARSVDPIGATRGIRR